MIPLLLLDLRGDAPAADGFRAVNSERELLEALLLGSETRQAPGFGDDFPLALLVRGESLCRWAQAMGQARAWKCVAYRSPLEALCEMCPALTREQALSVLHDLAAIGAPDALSVQSEAKPQVVDVLEKFYPLVAWRQKPGFEHAAAYLLWLEGANLPAHYKPLLLAQAELWSGNSAIPAALYAPTSQAAHTVLLLWLHLDVPETAAAPSARQAKSTAARADVWGEFPLPLPPRWKDEARRFYARLVTRQGVAVFETLRREMIPPALLEIAAMVVVDALGSKPESNTPALRAALLPHLLPHEASALQGLVRPDEPGEMPAGEAAALLWVVERYLPFRAWSVVKPEDQAAREIVHRLAREFGIWYLKWYAEVRYQGTRVARHLAARHAEEMRGSDESAVVLWVIADGLGWEDGCALARLICRSRRLTQAAEASGPVLAPIPTLTRFAKPAVRWGATPQAALNGDVLALRREVGVSGHRDASTALQQAHAGDIVVWTPLEPDKTYHEIADRDITRANVDGALQALAESIIAASSAAPDTVNLKIVLSTDHGRLLGGSTRRDPVPIGFQGHGRAAYAEAAYAENAAASPSSRAYDEFGIAIESDIAYLEAERFGLPVSCAVVLDDGAFLMNSSSGNGRGGVEEFPHGGVYPEEVVVPWIEIVRDAMTPHLECTLTGRARAGEKGTLQVALANPNAGRLVVESLTLSFGRGEVALSLEVPLAPYDTLLHSLTLETWPSSAQLKSGWARLTARHPDGRTFGVKPVLDLESDEMQSRDDILGDLI